MASESADPTALAARLLARAAGASRLIIGICGAPGAGKSTFAGMLVEALNTVQAGATVVVPMDGFHLARSVIAADERATRRGAPDTFDPDGYAALLERLRRNTDDIVYAPEFRREIEDPVAGAIGIPRECPIVLTEGNYLLHPDAAWRRVRAHLDDAVGKGARVLAGGHARPDVGPFVHEPTVIDGVTAAMACRDAETFGPLVALYRVSSDAHAVALANDTEYGLNASIWTRDVAEGRRLAAQIFTGTVSINEGYAAAWGSSGAPLGGRKDSGVGRRHGPEGIRRFTEAQSVTSQHGLGLGPPAGMSDEAWNRMMTRALRAMKFLGVR